MIPGNIFPKHVKSISNIPKPAFLRMFLRNLKEILSIIHCRDQVGRRHNHSRYLSFYISSETVVRDLWKMMWKKSWNLNIIQKWHKTHHTSHFYKAKNNWKWASLSWVKSCRIWNQKNSSINIIIKFPLHLMSRKDLWGIRYIRPIHEGEGLLLDKNFEQCINNMKLLKSA
jgi:hypothetical protein